MTDEQIVLARRAVACKGWRWMAGMLSGTGFRCVWADTWQIEWAAYGAHNCRRPNSNTDVPDLTDPATLGCLLALVREAMRDDSASVCREVGGSKWLCEGEHHYNGKVYVGVFAEGKTYAEALVAALEAAPCGQ